MGVVLDAHICFMQIYGAICLSFLKNIPNFVDSKIDINITINYFYYEKVIKSYVAYRFGDRLCIV